MSDVEKSTENIITGNKKIVRTPKEWLRVTTFDNVLVPYAGVSRRKPKNI